MLLDTSGFLSLLDSRERFHQRASDEYARAVSRLTHGYVVAELVALAGVRGLPSGVVLPFVMDLMANPDIEMIWPDQTLTAQAITLLLARQGRGYSLCDAVSFVIMRARNLQQALSTDTHFEDEGFQRLLV
jgi:predicted nucleic acid-binding protein